MDKIIEKNQDELVNLFSKSLYYFTVERKVMSQKELANKVNVSQSLISKFANGKAVPDFPLAIEIAEVFGHNLYSFLKVSFPDSVKERSIFTSFLKELLTLIAKYAGAKNIVFEFKMYQSKKDINANINDSGTSTKEFLEFRGTDVFGRISTEKGYASLTNFIKMDVSCKYLAKNMYPQSRGGYQGEWVGHELTDSYIIVNGNIYPERHFESVWNNEGEHLSFFNYVNNMEYDREDDLSANVKYANIESIMDAFSHNKHLFGVLGTLTASKFYWLVYLLECRNKLISDTAE